MPRQVTWRVQLPCMAGACFLAASRMPLADSPSHPRPEAFVDDEEGQAAGGGGQGEAQGGEHGAGVKPGQAANIAETANADASLPFADRHLTPDHPGGS